MEEGTTPGFGMQGCAQHTRNPSPKDNIVPVSSADIGGQADEDRVNPEIGDRSAPSPGAKSRRPGVARTPKGT